ncbi:MAG: fadF [Bacillales bacterium]|jgi:Fe-S oxidoreductase|nr:fadF [Bacillales bacterium]
MSFYLLINNFIFTILTGYALYLFSYLLLTRYKYIQIGVPITSDSSLKFKLKNFFIYVFGQEKLFKDSKSGVLHFLLFYGFIIIQFGAIDFIWKGISPRGHLPLGSYYSPFSTIQEVVAIVILFGVGWAYYRRYIEKVPRLKRNLKAAVVLVLIFILMVSVIFGNALDAVWHNKQLTNNEPITAALSESLSFLSPKLSMILFYIFWWIHTLALLIFLVYIPQGKHAHLIAAPINVFLKRKKSTLQKIDFEQDEIESFGVGRIEEYNQKQLLDLYACVECGRCTSMCPASVTGKNLSPMDVILKLRDHLNNKGAAITSKKPWVPGYLLKNTRGNEIARAHNESDLYKNILNESLAGDVIPTDEIWECTTCKSCEDQCPVLNEHVDKIIDIRRYLVMTEGSLPQEAQRTLTNIERQSNPWGVSSKEKLNWINNLEDIEVRTAESLKKEGRSFEYLLWIGSMGSYDERTIKITKSILRLFNLAQVDFAILGKEELNSGDTARRLGNEFLFQELAQKNIEIFNKYSVKKIITTDPHAFNIFLNEYKDFGLNIEVLHHATFLKGLVDEGKIFLENVIHHNLAYHDSCYLGRYNNVYDEPRNLLREIPGVRLFEANRNKCNSMCCGAGGGMMWVEEKKGKRINVERVQQLLVENVSAIATACPYCLTMLEDGTKAIQQEDAIEVYDIAELILESCYKR